MAERPVFVPAPHSPQLIQVLSFEILWHPGFAVQQKRKNVAALHAAAAQAGHTPVLEISTKSEEKLGQRLSAFNLKVKSDSAGQIPLECAFQASKVFERGGPYTDLLEAEHPRDAKRDPRLRDSGAIVGFTFNGFDFPNEPRTLFYDWLYISALLEHQGWLRTKSRFLEYVGFTDIEFNPAKSVNCQARSAALLSSLMRADLAERATKSAQDFLALVQQHVRSSVAEDRPHRLFP